MNTKTINAKLIAKIRATTCMNDYEEEVIKEALNKYFEELNEYFEEEYCNALNTARNSAYDEGFDDGYDVGYDAGHSAV